MRRVAERVKGELGTTHTDSSVLDDVEMIANDGLGAVKTVRRLQ
jgi:hypothetical protein